MANPAIENIDMTMAMIMAAKLAGNPSPIAHLLI